MGLPSIWNNDVGLASLVSLSSSGNVYPPEIYIPLVQSTPDQLGSITTTPNTKFASIQYLPSALGTSDTKLHTLNSNWNLNTKYAFEISIWSLNSSCIGYANLFDITSNTEVTSSRVSTNSTTAVVIRTGQLTLTAGHTYGVSVFTSNGTYACDVTDAFIIVFPS